MDKPAKYGVDIMKTKILAIIIVIVLAIGVAGVAVWYSLYGTPETPSGSMSIIDDYDRNVTITTYPPERIVCLAPSATEIIFALDLEDKLVGVDDYAYYPEEMQEVIDSNNIAIVGKYMGMSAEDIVALNPDLIIAAMVSQYDIIVNLANAGQTAMIIYPKNFTDVLDDITLVGEATGKTEKAEAVVTDMQNTAQEIANITQNAERPTVYIEYSFYEGAYATYGSGSFADEIITMAGGQNIFWDSPTAYTDVSSEQVITDNPDVIIIQEGAMSLAANLTVETVKNRVGWDAISAVQNDKIYTIEERLLLPGPAITQALEQIAEMLHPDLFN